MGGANAPLGPAYVHTVGQSRPTTFEQTALESQHLYMRLLKESLHALPLQFAILGFRDLDSRQTIDDQFSAHLASAAEIFWQRFESPPSPGNMMEKATETWVTAPERPISTTNRDACLVHIYPTGPGMGTRYALSNTALVIGRGCDCEIRINDHSVSRRHARIQPGTDGYYAVDLQSTNGTFVNDMQASMSKLKDGDYLRAGNCIYRFLAGGNVEAEYHEEIYRLTIIDALTETYNKRYLTEFLDRELSRSARYQRPLTLILFDIDLFRCINEEHGHLGGDFALREISARVKSVIRKEELFARYGGEEFVVVLPESTLSEGIKVSERIRSIIENHMFEFENKSFQITISLGVSTTIGDEAMTPSDLIRLADDKLYEAKRSGRNRVMA